MYANTLAIARVVASDSTSASLSGCFISSISLFRAIRMSFALRRESPFSKILLTLFSSNQMAMAKPPGGKPWAFGNGARLDEGLAVVNHQQAQGERHWGQRLRRPPARQ